MASSNSQQRSFYLRNLESTTISSSSSTSSWSFRKDQVVKFLKSKRDEYISTDSNGYGAGISKGLADPDNDHMAYQLARLPREAAFRRAEVVRKDDMMFVTGPPPPNPPFDNENLILYPSYSRKLENGEYDVDVRGMLFLPGIPNRKSRVASSLAMKLVGVSSGGGVSPISTDSALDELSKMELGEDYMMMDDQGQAKDMPSLSTPPPPPPPPRPRQMTSSTTSSSLSSRSFRNDNTEESTFKERFASLTTRAAPDREIRILIGLEGNHEQVVTSVTTFSNGRFLARIRTPAKPLIIHVFASDEVNTTIEPLVIGDDPKDSKISVITDIDDTIKHTGITGDKRQIFKNILVRQYEDIGIEGVVDWFSELEKEGVKFHYVSNSPWQLFSVINQYMSHTKLPKGSIHLKLYNGLISGLFEPSSEKKRIALHNIVKDFPDRQFILIGDSGEKDLEAYNDLATQYPKQILGIYIRDVTLPSDDQSLQDIISATGYIPTPSEIDSYNDGSSGRSGKVAVKQRMVREGRSRELNERNDVWQPSVASIPDLIDLSDEREEYPGLPTRPKDMTPGSQHKVPRKPPPPIPKKPQNLRPVKPMVSSTETPASSATSTAPTPNPSPPPPRIVSKSEANIADPIFSNPPPLPPRRVATSPGASNTDVLIMNSEQNDYGQLVLDKKVEQWKSRVTRSRLGLPAGVRLRMWRVGNDLRDESLALVRDAKMN